MIIGNFRPAGDTFAGTIKTLTFKIDAVFNPIAKKGEKSPDYRITTGDTEIGAAWKETSENTGKAYLSVQLDSPSLPAPIKCALVKTGAEYGHSLVWDRPRRQS